MATGRRFVSAPDTRYEKYYKILGYLQFGLYDMEKICETLDGEAKKAVEERVRFYLDKGLLVKTEQAALHLSVDGIFWGNNIAVDILGAAIKAEQRKESCYA
jgi:oxygen-independent coproporphyrinogen-3 oxidase